MPVVEAAVERDRAPRVLNAIVPEEGSGIAFEVWDYQLSSRVFRKSGPRYADSARENCRADDSFRFHSPGRRDVNLATVAIDIRRIRRISKRRNSAVLACRNAIAENAQQNAQHATLDFIGKMALCWGA
jgi:hypothetical protein